MWGSYDRERAAQTCPAQLNPAFLLPAGRMVSLSGGPPLRCRTPAPKVLPTGASGTTSSRVNGSQVRARSVPWRRDRRMPRIDDIQPFEDLDTAATEYMRAFGAADPATRQRLREEFVRRALPFAHRLARRYRGRGEPPEDLEQVARLGLIKTVDRY